MVFSSIIFLCVFMPIVFITYFLCPAGLRNILLLVASLVFYAWGEPVYILVMLFSTFFNYLSGRLVYIFKNRLMPKQAKTVLVISIIESIAVLFLFKYTDFFIQMVNMFSIKEIPLIGIALPAGISFYTFQIMSYTIDVYRGRVEAQKNIIDFAMYVCMFPQLIAGPVVRYEQVAADIHGRKLEWQNIALGFQRFVTGLGKKVIFANMTGALWEDIYNASAADTSVLLAWLGAVAYTFQIYFDFSGYSDMAIGLGRIFGFHFPENFLYPYKSVSVTEFWRRWHISLSSWFRDYLYIPMGGSRKGNVYLHLLIVFVCTGLWHGADYTFIVWGLWHGVFILIERVIKQKSIRINVPCALRWLYTMSVVMIGWVFFKADTLQDAIGCLAAMCGRKSGEFIQYNTAYYFDLKIFCVIAAGLCISFGIPKKAYEKTRHIKAVRLARDVFLLAVLFVSMITAVNGNYSPFIYFRF